MTASTHVAKVKATGDRLPEFPVNPIFLHRWSPRSMTGDPLPHKTLMSLFEAAKWAPSSGNNQPWRFLYAGKASLYWPAFFELLNEGNKSWAKNASVLVVMVSKTTSDRSGKPTRTHSFDTGAAWENLALQASLLGLVAHGMAGFDYDKAREALGVPEDHAVEAMCAIGYPDDPEKLPEDKRKMEVPSQRKSVSEIAFEGGFTAR